MRYLDKFSAVIVRCPPDLLYEGLVPDLIMNEKRVLCHDLRDMNRGSLEATYAAWGKSIAKAIHQLSQPFDVFLFEGGYHLFWPFEQASQTGRIRESIHQMWGLIGRAAKNNKNFIFRTDIHPSNSYFDRCEIPLGSKIFFASPLFEHQHTKEEMESIIGQFRRRPD